MIEYPFATEEQKGLADVARTILEKELKPRLEDLRKANNGCGQFPMDIYKKLADAGYVALNLEEEWGGLNLDSTTQTIICEEMARVDAGFTASSYWAGYFFHFIAQTHISQEEKESWAERTLSGDAIGTICLTEPDGGSDTGAIRSYAYLDGDEWVLNGTKAFISNAPIANYHIVLAWTDKTQRKSKGMSMFFVESDRPGVSLGRLEDKIGYKLSMTSQVIFEDVRIPKDHIIGEPGQGYGLSAQQLAQTRVALMAFNVGLAQHCMDLSIDYAKTRRAFGKRIIDHEGLGFKIAEMQARTDASRALLYQTARMIDEGMDIGHFSSSAKFFITDCTMQTGIDAVEVFGAYGTSHEYEVGLLMNEAKMYQILDGTTEIQKMILARDIAGRDPQAAAR